MKSKLFSLIVSVLAAMCLWVYVMTVVNPDVDLVIGFLLKKEIKFYQEVLT